VQMTSASIEIIMIPSSTRTSYSLETGTTGSSAMLALSMFR
jgi:hypothetical protein